MSVNGDMLNKRDQKIETERAVMYSADTVALTTKCYLAEELKFAKRRC